MSRLFDLLQGIITKVNSIKGCSANWDQNDPNGAGYIENRTHYREPTAGNQLLSVDMSTVENGIESYEEDGETKYRWTQNSYRVSVTSYGGLEDYIWLMSDFFGWDEICEVSSGDAGTSLSNSRFSLERREVSLGDGDWGWAWIFTPKIEPTKSMLDWLADDKEGGRFNFDLFSIEYRYEKLDPQYLPVVDYVSYGSDMIPNCGAVVDAIDAAKKDVDYLDLKNSPCYDIPERDEYVIYPREDGTIDGYSEDVVDLYEYCKSWIQGEVDYVIKFQGEEYLATGVHISTDDVFGYPVTMLGNQKMCKEELPESDYPFCICLGDRWCNLYFEGQYAPKQLRAPFYVAKRLPREFKQLDEKFLPDSQITSAEIDQLAELIK